ncbi:S8 family serine peptidase [Acetivibrio thermocellus]|jgi:subtilisin family serine protease|uniref:Peptidase S8 n=3 Tax=Acetivibrio TaxID=35829 RepID=A0A2S8R6V8_9FIRM|nr:S8 family serine peptidase [Acetivibrio thermocellus]PQQ65526.1 peptidase S8 [Acetivibrio saccincola]CDG37617.1 peptidase S8 and S53 subtilisin kexin sedolisin [Acetivibrio thermocellus BC1]ADU73768.1 peptidase S8 and S53 subtilisin kexin sedolisin [Acetivibrio thermocellus DSM 1313]ALX07699.1 peptidase S8 and S53 subtilisin kexin sedolisin [Acetivibrio thermocellus AD2]ANV75441.1 peptidase S8 and S53 subtilisin kexin sedolisin [Acetivibrio thermocellus DSM 2360]
MSFKKHIAKFLALTTVIAGTFAGSQFALANNNSVDLGLKSNYVNSDCSFAEGRVIVGFKEGYDISIISNKLQNLGVESFEDLTKAQKPAKANDNSTEKKKKKKIYLLYLKDKTKDGVLKAIEKLNNEPNVAYAEPDFLIETASEENNNEGKTENPMEIISALEAMGLCSGNQDVVVGVIDSGIDYNHPDLINHMWINTAEANGLPGVDDDGNGYTDDIYGYDFGADDSDPMDIGDHGTHCAGIIAGFGPNVKIASLKHLSGNKFKDLDNWVSTMIKAINYADAMDIKIVNVSLGLHKSQIGDRPFDSQALNDAISNADLLFVTAAGNFNKNIDLPDDVIYPASCTAENIITVANTDKDDKLYESSNYGVISVDLAAPGTDIRSTIPTHLAGEGGPYDIKTGTSMSAPHVAGAAALLLSSNPSLTTQQLKDLILSSVDFLPDLQGKVATSGRLNVAKALRKIRTSVKIGDIDGNGEISSIDYAILKSHLINSNLTFKQLAAADVDGNGYVNSIDLAILQMYLLGKGGTSDIGKNRIYTYGDIDNNGIVDENDYILICNHINGTGQLSDASLFAADADGNNVIDQTDRILIEKYITGRITHLPVGNQ